jgi:hypothetical protein
MPDVSELDDLIAYLVRSTRLSAGEAARVVDEVLAYLSELPEDYIRRRHAELQRDGKSNAEIFARLAREVAARRFKAPAYSERQIRRIVYG